MSFIAVSVQVCPATRLLCFLLLASLGSAAQAAAHMPTPHSPSGTVQPDFTGSTLTVSDLNGGGVRPGDTLEYLVTVRNDGNDIAQFTSIDETLPAGITYVAGSMEVLSGANVGAKTDIVGDDQAEYDVAQHKLTARLGTGAGISQGGQLAAGQQTAFRFHATVDAACTLHSSIANQATIHGTGVQSGLPADTLSDGDPGTSGQQPTIVIINVDCLTVNLPPAPAHGSVSSDLPGFACSSGTCTTNVATGTQVALTAAPDASYAFAGWSDDCAAAGSSLTATITMDAPKTCSASFSLGAAHNVSITVTGLSGSGLVAALNAIEDLPLTANSTFTYVAQVNAGAAYNVAITTQPSNPDQLCNFTGAVPPTGTMPASDLLLQLDCTSNVYSVGGTVAGLFTSGLVLRLNGKEDLPVASGSTSFVFATQQLAGGTYAVTISAQPSGQTCSTSNASGTIGSADVTDVAVTCSDLVLTLTDDREYARYGHVTDYVLTLTNHGATTASATGVQTTLSAAFDLAATHWQCVPGAGAACVASGTGDILDSVTVPAGQSVTWMMQAMVLADTVDNTADISAAGEGAGVLSDSNTIVIFRDHFDVVDADGTQIAPPASDGILSGPQTRAFVLPAATARLIDDVLQLRGTTAVASVQVLNLGTQRWIRLSNQPAVGIEQVGAWSVVSTGAHLAIGSTTGADGQRVLLLEGATEPLMLATAAPSAMK
ncbi:MAG: hypothetical protein ABIW82_08650 [Dokdonella sp.]